MKCDLRLDEFDNQDNAFSGAVYPYPVFKVPLGSVKSVLSSSTFAPNDQPDFHTFDVIIDSGCTTHMVCFQVLFITYKPCLQSYVILEDKSKVPCLGTGCVSMLLGRKKVIFHVVLHVSSL